MEAIELRIGNLLDYYGQTVIVLGIFRHEHLELGYFNDSIGFSRDIRDGDRPVPIPLTEEWLIKFGFEKKFDNYSLLEWRFHINKPANYDGFLLCEGYSVITDRINYVHQLQNLYFAITGEELEY